MVLRSPFVIERDAPVYLMECDTFADRAVSFFAEASDIMKSIGEAIQFLHAINIAHRDVKVCCSKPGVSNSRTVPLTQ